MNTINNIYSDFDKTKLKLDYENYDDGYSNNNPYEQAGGDIQPIKSPETKGIDVKLPELDFSGFAPSKDVPDINLPTETDSASKGAFGSIGGKGTGFADNAGGIANFGMQQLSMFQNEASSEKESWANVGNSTLGGASVGMSVGGPIGAAIGGGLGLVTSVIDMIGDTKKRNEKTRENYDKVLELASTKRKQDWQLKQGEESINKLTQLRKAQLNYITDF